MAELIKDEYVKKNFCDEIRKLNIKFEFIFVKPNWTSCVEGEYTESEILDWVLSCFTQKKFVLESYMVSRSENIIDGLKTDLVEGKKYWSDYKAIDRDFLDKTGCSKVLAKHKAQYLNITNEYWSSRMADPRRVRKMVEEEWGRDAIQDSRLYSFIPESLLKIGSKACLVSLAKIKTENEIKSIMVSLSMKNLFGLLPDPLRYVKYHGNNHEKVPGYVRQIYMIYKVLFGKMVGINESVFSRVENYCSEKQSVLEGDGKFYIGENIIELDRSTCLNVGINPDNVEYLNGVDDAGVT